MSDISKFLSDIQRIKKHVRQDNGGHYDGAKVCEQIANLFATNNRHIHDFAQSISDYWFNTYILESDDIENEPTEKNVNLICAFQSFVDGESNEDYSLFSADDWETLRDFADDCAETMDLDQLQNIMSLILKNGAL